MSEETFSIEKAKTNNLDVIDNSQFDIDNINPITNKQLLESYFLTLIQSKKTSIKSVQEAFALLQKTKELKVPFLTGVEHVHVINGKTGIDIHLIKTLLSRAGNITWEKTKDYLPLYEYTDGSIGYIDIPNYCVIVANKDKADKLEDGKVGVWICKYYKPYSSDQTLPAIAEYNLTDSHCIISNKEEATKAISEGKQPVYMIPVAPVDYVTEYKFTRYLFINNKEVIQTSIGKFSVNEATSAGLIGGSSDAWKKYPKHMIATRAFTYGARDIASDVIQGCYETNELKIINNKKDLSHESPEDVECEII